MKKSFLVICLIVFLAYTPFWSNAASSNFNDPNRSDRTLQSVMKRGKLIVGVSTKEPPFGFYDQDGKLKGIDIDIAEALARKIFKGADKIEFVPAPVESMLDLLKSGKIDLLMTPLSATEERKKEIDFSVPYFISGHLVAVEPDSKIHKYGDLTGKRVGVIRGTMGEKMVPTFVTGSKIVEFQSNDEVLKALHEHKVDAFVQLDVFIFYMEQKDRDLRVINLQPLQPAPIGIGIRKGEEEWRGFIDRALSEMMKSGEYRKLLDKWFGKIRAEFLEISLKDGMKE